MRRKIEVLSPAKLAANLTAWRTANPKAFQLDGSRQRVPNRTPYCAIDFNGMKFYLAMDTTRDGVDLFLERVKHLGSATQALVIEKTKNDEDCLRIHGHEEKAQGFYCYFNGTKADEEAA